MDNRSLNRKEVNMKTIVHVNQHMIKYNKKWGTEYPVLTVKHGGKTYYGHQVTYHDGCETIYRPHQPLSCGAVCWIETDGDVSIFDWNAKSHEDSGLTHPMITNERKTIRRLGSKSWTESDNADLINKSDERFDRELSVAIDHELIKNPSEWKQNENPKYQEDPENWVD